MPAISSSDVQAIIASAVGEMSVKILDYKLEPFSAEKCGILGEHYSLSIKLEHQQNASANDGVKTYKFFVKCLDDINKLPQHLDESVFEEEIHFYNDILPLMLANYSGEKWYAECYLAKSGVLVLEDLRERGFSVRAEQTMDEKALKSAAASLARFHACSVMAEAKIGKPLNEAFPHFFSEKICNDNNKFGRAVKLGYETTILMAEKLNLDASFVLPHVYNYVSAMVKPQKHELNVVCHSDLYRFNIMFNAANTAVILDYQLSRYASPVIDLSIFLHLNSTPEFRKTSEMDILKHYYSVFRETLHQSKAAINIPSYQDMLKKYNQCKIVGMATSVDYLAFLYIDPEQRSNILNNSEMLQHFLLHNRINVIGFQLQTSQDFAKKMKDILSEYLDEAKRVLGSIVIQ